MKSDFARPILTVDVVLFTLRDGQLHVLLDRRDREPFDGKLALPGGYIHAQEDEDTHGAARRVLLEKVGARVPYLEQLACFSGADRDPRGWSATIAYISMVLADAQPYGGRFRPVDYLPSLAFDHNTIVYWAAQRLRNKASYSSLPLVMMPTEFTLTELQQVYETMMGGKMDKATFRRKIKERDIIEPTGEMTDPKLTGTRPAELYRAVDRAVDRSLWLFSEEFRAA